MVLCHVGLVTPGDDRIASQSRHDVVALTKSYFYPTSTSIKNKREKKVQMPIISTKKLTSN